MSKKKKSKKSGSASDITGKSVSKNSMNNDGLGSASLVLGIVSIVLFFFWPLAILCAILAIIFGAVSFNKGKNSHAKTGTICGIIGLIAALIFLVVLGAYLVKNDDVNELNCSQKTGLAQRLCQAREDNNIRRKSY